MAILDFFVEREDRKAVPKKIETMVKETPAPVTSYTQPVGGSTIEFTEHFRKILRDENEKNFPGNDFYEFFLVKSNMTGISEQQAYIVAFSGLSAAGLTKQKLLDTAQQYLKIIEREMSEFDQSYNEMYGESVTKLEEGIAAKTQELNQLSQKITTLNNEIMSAKQEIMHNTQKLSEKKTGFTLAGNAQKNEIQSEITKINQYIQ